MTVRMRHTRSHTANRRSHHSLKEPRISLCMDCKAPHKRHNVCLSCGRYKGRVVIDMAVKFEKKQAKAKAKKEAMSEEATSDAEQTEDKILNAEELSKK